LFLLAPPSTKLAGADEGGVSLFKNQSLKIGFKNSMHRNNGAKVACQNQVANTINVVFLR
jgi:hypothetical protein